MMKNEQHRCLDFPALEALVDLPPAAAARALADCPRCQARLSLLTEFLGDAAHPPGAQPEAAARRLRRALAVELDAAQLHRGRHQLWLQPRLVWSLAAGLAAVVCLIALGGERGWFTAEPPERWRGERPGAEISLLSPQTEVGGALLLSWRSLSGAAGYRVDLLDADLRLLGSIAATDTLLRVDPTTLPAGARAALAWQVTALAAEGGAVLARSPLGRLPRP